MNDFELERIMQPYLPGHHIVLGSTPVTSFGNPHTSRIATLGINPSSREFLNETGNLLSGGEKRLTDFETLGKVDQLSLTRLEAERVITLRLLQNWKSLSNLVQCDGKVCPCSDWCLLFWRFS